MMVQLRRYSIVHQSFAVIKHKLLDSPQHISLNGYENVQKEIETNFSSFL